MKELLPHGWAWIDVEDLAANEPSSLTDGPFGSNLKTSHYTEDGPRVIRLQNIGDGVFFDERAHISEEHFQRLRCHEARANDIVIAMLGERLPRACVVPDAVGPAIVKADCVRLRVESGLSSPPYVTHALNSHQVRSQAEELVHGVGRPRLGLKWLRSLKIPMAPLPEQRRIVEAIESYFTRLDDAAATLERVERNLKRYRASVLKAAVEGRLVPTAAELARAEGRDYEPASVVVERIMAERRRRSDDIAAVATLPVLPEGWAWSTLGQLADIKGGITKGQRPKTGVKYREVPYLRVANVQRGYLDLRTIKLISASEDDIADLRLQPGDVLFNEGGDRDKLGRGWVWKGEISECIHQNHVFRARVVRDSILPEFLSWYGNTAGQQYFFEEGKHTTNLASINMTKLRALPVPVPPWNEQLRIYEAVEERLSAVDDALKTVERQEAKCDGLRQSILKWAFEGRLVDQDPTDEPTSVLLEHIKAERAASAGNQKRRMPRRKGNATTA